MREAIKAHYIYHVWIVASMNTASTAEPMRGYGEVMAYVEK